MRYSIQKFPYGGQAEISVALDESDRWDDLDLPRRLLRDWRTALACARAWAAEARAATGDARNVLANRARHYGVKARRLRIALLAIESDCPTFGSAIDLSTATPSISRVVCY